MGKKSSVEFYGGENKVCGKCGMTEKKGCCNDKHQFYKLQDAHKIVSAEDKINFTPLLICSFFPLYNWPLTSLNVDKVYLNHSPPDNTSPSICIMNCIFRL